MIGFETNTVTLISYVSVDVFDYLILTQIISNEVLLFFIGVHVL